METEKSKDILREIAKQRVYAIMKELDTVEEAIIEMGFEKELRETESALLKLLETLQFKKFK